MLTDYAMIIEDSANTFWAVRDLSDIDHCWLGIPVKRAGGSFVPKSKAKPRLVRKDCTRIVGRVA